MTLDISKLETEQPNPKTRKIDECSTDQILKLINDQDQTIAGVVRKTIPKIGQIVEAATNAIKNGGHVYYVGAGTSGRLGVLDAAECPPTYGVSPELFQGILAGGKEAIFVAKEGVEDSEIRGKQALVEHNLAKSDLVIGIAASGRTPYVIGALKYANDVGAGTASIACVTNSALARYAKIAIEAVTGPEVITGSTRMKSGTAQKLILNMISTTTMIKLGKVYENYMVDVSPTNQKLEVRACNMIKLFTDLDDQAAKDLFIASHKEVKTAIVMYLKKVDYKQAKVLLDKSQGHIRQAIKE